MENKESKKLYYGKILNAYLGGAIPIYWRFKISKLFFNPDLL